MHIDQYRIALLSPRAVGPKPRHEALVRLRVEGLPIQREWQLVYRVDKTLSCMEQALLDELILQATAARAGGNEISKAKTSRKRKLSGGPAPVGSILEGSP